jgi:DNA-3-methyladenine glycosylase I
MGGKPLQNQCLTFEDVPTHTELSTEISKGLKKRGFNFCGPTIVYAFMQAVGMVNDHQTTCFRYEEVKAMGR